MANAHHTSFINQEVVSTSQNNALSTRLTAVETLNALQQQAINLNTSKITSPFTVSGSDLYIQSKFLGLDNSNPECTLDIGDGNLVPCIRLNGSENATTSSELIFSDVYSSGDSSTDYGAGCGIRWDSQNNQLQFIVDAQTGSSLINAGYLQRHEFPSWNLPRVSIPTSFTAYNIDQTPKSIFLYASRVKIISSGLSVNPLTIPNTATNIAFLNSIESGIDNAESTGIITISSAGLYKFMVMLSLDQTGSQKQFKVEFRHTDGTLIWDSSDHLSREESSLSFSAMSVNTFKYVGIGTYRFILECDQDGTGRVQNLSTSATTLMIEKMVLPNGYTLSSSYPTA